MLSSDVGKRSLRSRASHTGHSSGRRRGSGPLLLMISGLVVVMAAIGYLVSRPSDETVSAAQFDQYARVSNVTVSYPSDWQRAATGGAPSPGLTHAFTIEPQRTPGEQLVIGEGTGSDPSLLPAAMLAKLDHPAAPQLVTLGPLRFYRYLHLTVRGAPSPETVYALRTTTGNVVAVCLEGTSSTAFVSSCERVLRTLRLGAGTALPPGLSIAYARALNRILGQLNVVRRRAGSQLGARRLTARLNASESLAKAHARAAAALASIGSGPPGQPNHELTNALRTTGDAYQQLARAIENKSVGSYRRAQAALGSASASLELAFARLERIGYRGD
jgi:hypothetical protein